MTGPACGPGFYAFALVAIAVAGISKGGFCSGVGGVAFDALA